MTSFAVAQKTTFSFDTLFTHHRAQFDSVIQHRQDYRLQILYTRIDRDTDHFPHLTTYSYDADQYYYYCASMVKLPACALTLEKLNNLADYKVDMLDSLGIDSISCTELNPQSIMLGTPYSCLGHYIKEMLMLSNNRAFNPVYDFLGQAYFQDRLHQIGYTSAVISHRFAACDTVSNRICDPVSLYDRHTHQLKYYQPCINNERRQFYNGELNPQVGIGYLGAADQLINQPKDFRFANYISLSDLHRFLTKVILPETQQRSEKLNLTPRDYQYLYKCMGIFPRESAYPKLDSIKYPDQYMKYFMGLDSTVQTMPDNLRIFNKVGQAYGFMTDCSYIVDTLNRVEFFLSCSIYLNADGILNDGVYEYDQIGYPFFKNLFNAIYEQELIRPKKYLPTIQLPDFSDTLLVKPVPSWLKVDSFGSMEKAESALCKLADSMLAMPRNSDGTFQNTEENFNKNLEVALRMKTSKGYAFEKLQKKSIHIIRSADSIVTFFSWKNSSNNITDLMQTYSPNNGVVLKWIEEDRSNIIEPSDRYSRMEIVPIRGEKIYLLWNQTEDSTITYLQAFKLNKGMPEVAKIFKPYSKRDCSSVIQITEFKNKRGIRYDSRHKLISFDHWNIQEKKLKPKKYKLKFDGNVFK